MIKKGSGRAKSGVALLFVISILGLLVLIGVSFALNMILTRKEASNFLNSAKARYIAEAGIKKAIMDIRGQVASSSYSNLKTYISNYVAASGTNVAFGGGRYTLTIVSEEGKVNINTFDPEPLTDPVTGAPNTQLTILRTFLTDDKQIANIVDYRDTNAANTVIGAATGDIEADLLKCKNKPFDTIQEIIIATGISKAVFDANKDKITVTKPIIRGGLLGKYYSGLEADASPNVKIDHSTFAKKVIELGPVYQTPNDTQLPGTDGYEPSPADIGWAETHDSEFAGASSVAPAGDFGIETFGVIWDGYLDIRSGEEGSAITFSVAVDDGARLFINGTSILPAGSWQDQSQTTYTGTYTFQTPGWHKIQLEYYDNTSLNTVHLKWNVGGSLVVIPADRLGYDPPTEVVGGYDSAGIYTITATASVVESGAAVATKQMTAVVEIFDTWTQTTKEEFYSAWFNLKGDFSDGEVFNVNWLDSCPTDEDYWDAGTSKMHWEGAYATTPDSVKLGYWDNFDEDPAFSSVMMKGYQWNRAYYGFGTLNVSFQDFKDGDSDGDNELYIRSNTFEAKHFELNRYYFAPNTPSVFVRAYIQQPAPHDRIAWRGSGTPYTGTIPPKAWPLYVGSTRNIYYDDWNDNDIFDGTLGQAPTGEPEVYPVYDAAGNPTYIEYPTAYWPWDLDSIPAPGTYTYWQPEAPFDGCWLFAKGNADDPRSLPWPPSGPGNLVANGFKTLSTDGHGYVQVATEPPPLPLYPFGDTSEIRLGQLAFSHVQFNYPYIGYPGECTEVLAMIGSDNSVDSAAYCAWINGALGDNQAWWADWSKAYPNGPIFKFVANNQCLGWDWEDFDRGQHVIGGTRSWDKGGSVTHMDTYWDDIRCIPESTNAAPGGYLVSVPFYAGSSPIRWGTVSWTRQTPPLAQTNIEMYTRKTTTTFPTTDSGWTYATSNGVAVGGTEPWMQYKAVLTTGAINRNSYSQSSRTPVLEDVAITYMPVVQIKYWREGS